MVNIVYCNIEWISERVGQILGDHVRNRQCISPLSFSSVEPFERYEKLKVKKCQLRYLWNLPHLDIIGGGLGYIQSWLRNDGQG